MGVHTTSHDLLDYWWGRAGPATDGVNIVDHKAPTTLNSRICGADISPLDISPATTPLSPKSHNRGPFCLRLSLGFKLGLMVRVRVWHRVMLLKSEFVLGLWFKFRIRVVEMPFL